MSHKCSNKVLKNVESKEKVRIHTNFIFIMLHSLIFEINISSVNTAEIRKCLICTNVIYCLATN